MEAKDLNKSFGWFLPAVAISSNALFLYLIVAKQRLCKKPYWFILSLTTADFFVRFTYILFSLLSAFYKKRSLLDVQFACPPLCIHEVVVDLEMTSGVPSIFFGHNKMLI